MFGLTTLGLIHTVISLVAIVSGAIALVRDHRITLGNSVGRLFVLSMVLTCVTGFGFFGTNSAVTKGQTLGFITIAVIVVAYLAERRHAFGGASAAVATVGWSAVFFFNMIPFFAQTLTRLPSGKPVFADDTAQGLAVINAVMFILFLIGAYLQVRKLRRG